MTASAEVTLSGFGRVNGASRLRRSRLPLGRGHFSLPGASFVVLQGNEFSFRRMEDGPDHAVRSA